MDALEGYKRAGKILSEVRASIKIKPGMKLVEIADSIEQGIRERGGGLAFPVNTSLNEVAAHYVAQYQDQKTVEAGDLLKVDMGAQVEGWIADSAFTYCSEKEPLIQAAEKAIEEAVKVIRPGVTVGEVSQVIEQTVEGAGFGLIVNLTGHGVDQGAFHAPPPIPNIATGSRAVLEEGQAIALEPFLAQDSGQVKESAPCEIYRFLQPKPVRLTEARHMLQLIQEKYEAYPFAKRWLYQHFSPVKVSLALRQLEAAGAIESYPPLKEVSNQRVVQAEHTIIVQEKPIVTSL